MFSSSEKNSIIFLFNGKTYGITDNRYITSYIKDLSEKEVSITINLSHGDTHTEKPLIIYDFKYNAN